MKLNLEKSVPREVKTLGEPMNQILKRLNLVYFWFFVSSTLLCLVKFFPSNEALHAFFFPKKFLKTTIKSW